MRRVILPAAARPSPEINVTPLVDVVLVLLIIFMVATPLTPLHLPLDLPDPPASPTEGKPTPELHLSASGELLLDRVPLSREDLTARLHTEPALLLTADDAAAYAALIDALDLAKSSGVKSFTFAAP
jgi:biopolymer transport protein ExbD